MTGPARPGHSAEARQPLGLAMVGGLLVSQLLTLYLTPVIYVYLDRLSHWRPFRRGDAITVPAEQRDRDRSKERDGLDG